MNDHPPREPALVVLDYRRHRPDLGRLGNTVSRANFERRSFDTTKLCRYVIEPIQDTTKPRGRADISVFSS
jgi:hypothetical protein